MGKTSQENGKKFETKLCEYLSKKGWYVVYMEKGVTGSQPCDIVAIRNNLPLMIECKNLTAKNGLFPISRIEQNQLLSYKKFKSCHNSNFILAINWNNEVYLVDFDWLKFYQNSIDLKIMDPEFRWEEDI